MKHHRYNIQRILRLIRVNSFCETSATIPTKETLPSLTIPYLTTVFTMTLSALGFLYSRFVLIEMLEECIRNYNNQTMNWVLKSIVERHVEILFYFTFDEVNFTPCNSSLGKEFLCTDRAYLVVAGMKYRAFIHNAPTSTVEIADDVTPFTLRSFRHVSTIHGCMLRYVIYITLRSFRHVSTVHGCMLHYSKCNAIQHISSCGLICPM